MHCVVKACEDLFVINAHLNLKYLLNEVTPVRHLQFRQREDRTEGG